jgi:hypothetical protein
MRAYRIRYVCETALQSENDVTFQSGGRAITFLFSEKRNEGSLAHVRLEAETPDYRQADVIAQSILQPVLDALSCTTGSPLLAQHWDLIIKSEAGSRTRRALWCEKRKQPAPVRLTQRTMEDAQKILAQEGHSALCWHRYALQRNLILDRFLFQWLAFEGLAGKTQIPTICRECEEIVTHCDKAISHEGSDGNNAYQLYSRVDSDMSTSKFKKEVWGRTRNSVFHGNKYPSPNFLSQIHALTPKLRRACDSEFNQRYGLGDQARPIQDLELHIYRTNMFEWDTKNVQSEFADDFPADAVDKEFGNMAAGEYRMGFPETWPFKLINLKESENW